MTAAFSIWGRIEQLAPAEFLVVVSAVSEDFQKAEVMQELRPCRQSAEEARAALMIQMGAQLAARGARVLDVIDD